MCDKSMDIDMTAKDPLPHPLSAKYKESFAYPTIKDRLPVILTKVIDYVYRKRNQMVLLGQCSNEDASQAQQQTKEVIGRLAKLRNELQTNKPLIELASNASDVLHWNNQLAQYKSKNACDAFWFEAPWLYVECYLYRRIREAFELSPLINSFDPFEEQKQEALKSSMGAMHILGDYLHTFNAQEYSLEQELFKFTQLCLWGNKCDLSISAGSQNSQLTSPLDDLTKMRSQIVCNELPQFWNFMNNLSKSKESINLAIVLDNAGFELFSDLCFVQFLITSKILGEKSCVKFYVKKMPWFVSDTMTKDFIWTLDYLCNAECTHSNTLQQLGSKWKQYLKTGQWIIVEDDYWTLHNDYAEMAKISPNLYQSLSEADIILFKGDLNYRKLVGDLNWKFDVPFITSLRGFLPTTICSLRTIKCDVVVGIKDNHILESIKSFPSNWMETGDYAVIQFVQK